MEIRLRRVHPSSDAFQPPVSEQAFRRIQGEQALLPGPPRPVVPTRAPPAGSSLGAAHRAAHGARIDYSPISLLNLNRHSDLLASSAVRLRRFFRDAQEKTPVAWLRGSSFFKSLAVSYSHMAIATLSSALCRFTSVFGMGTGGSNTLWPPGKLADKAALWAASSNWVCSQSCDACSQCLQIH